ncbi:Membrane-bound metallopeptidase-like protein [Alkaliphilus metalliredigens QYMF]|uniref:Membrane-bound metallopeptidase-like protein n=1 Tax=Alkaliphilus metalliredigens (strain QYMF) TaxID=293826 RepID=A6TKM9_ALKMQ|nr:hypothetical protein [Alkaliphilus metalliredigens]ABR46747.1 Membrane-bound metallopeptidase-like protein [Alkaliphilus metalliredigens QYMF]
MFKTKKTRVIMSFSFAILFTLLFLPLSMATEQADPFSEIQENLTGISQEERQIIENLFILVQEIEEMENEETELLLDLSVIEGELKVLENLTRNEELAYEERRDVLKHVLKSYQRRGPGSYLEIVLSSDSLSALLRRLNTLRDLTRNTGALLDELAESKEKLSIEKSKLTEKAMLVEAKQQELQQSIARNLQLQVEQEAYLASLEDQREYYQEHLSNIQSVWDELKLIFSASTKEFSRIIGEGNLPTDAMEISFTSLGIKGTIDEDVINALISEYLDVEELRFNFHPGMVQLKMPNQHLVLTGTFVIENGHTLKFVAEEGSFYGILLTSSAVKELFKEGALVLNLKPLLFGNTLRSVEVQEGSLELLSRLRLF